MQKCTLEGSSLNCTTAYDLSSRDYNKTEGIEQITIKGSDYFVISALNSSGTPIFDIFYPNFTLIHSLSLGKPAGKLEFFKEDGYLYVAGNESGYKLYRCVFLNLTHVECSKEKNFSQGIVVDGLAYHPFNQTWFYASNQTNNATEISFLTYNYLFRYQVKDTKLGYPVEENFKTTTKSERLFLPAERNYSIMIYPEDAPAFPVKITISEIDTVGNNVSVGNENRTVTEVGGSLYLNLSDVNLTTSLIQLTGYAKYNNSAEEQNYSSFRIVAYLIESGNMVFKGATLPPNMGKWKEPAVNDTFNTTNGFYNMTLPASALGSHILLFATASVNESGNIVYYGAFREVTLTYGQNPGEINFTMYRLLGNASNITLGFEESENVTTAMKSFRLTNGSVPISSAHIEIEIDYSNFTGSNETLKFLYLIIATTVFC